jgi:hypothetical protein
VKRQAEDLKTPKAKFQDGQLIVLGLELGVSHWFFIFS